MLDPSHHGPALAAVLSVALSLAASLHALRYKRDVRAAIGWAGFAWFVPFLGPVAYFLFGINRIQRKASQRRAASPRPTQPPAAVAAPRLPGELRPYAALRRLIDRLEPNPLTAGNRVRPLEHGDAAYPEMLAAIAAARSSVSLSTYIFDADPVGLRFAEALAAAVARGVEVRVLVDAVGARYSFPTILRHLRRLGVPAATFLPPLLPGRLAASNLRNHRKILVVDGRIGFTGGMNLRVGHQLRLDPPDPIRDLHFRIEGPVVAQLQHAFVEDWAFATGEELTGPAWFPALDPAGPTLARALPDGPDLPQRKLRWVYLGALACARRRIRIVTPYFLPDQPLVMALGTAVLRGVEVEILLPARNNLPWVAWAMEAQLWQVLEHGCQVYLTEGPFDHTKLLLVDDAWALVGSPNWDPRSLRLNFEVAVELYDLELCRVLHTLADTRRARARQVTLEELDHRPAWIQLRDALARIAIPYM